MAQFFKVGPAQAGDIDSESASAGQVLTADGSGAAMWAAAPLGIPIPVTADWATSTNMTTDLQNVLGVVSGQVVRGTVFAPVFSSFSATIEIYDDGTGIVSVYTYVFGTFPSAGKVYFHIKELSDI